ncbi:protein goliath [Caerostris darwini]|uniref:Protein goliath n=1 Tax=Caerostris darwini TaxID=1538125 RepID=A0AAV4WLK7_9ARAC|nr:protein goliath [Caerostris darwini]
MGQANRITFVVINERKGEQIAALVDNGTRIIMRIGIGGRNTTRYGQINRTSVLFVSISFILLMIISFAWLVFYYVQRFRYIHAKEIMSVRIAGWTERVQLIFSNLTSRYEKKSIRRLCSAAKRALDKIPIKTVSSDDSEHENDNECCAICIEHFQSGELIRTLPCNHCFHKICIDPWLLEQRSCPMCKLDILSHFGMVYTGSQESVLEIEDDEFFRVDLDQNAAEHEIVLVQTQGNQRRHSSVRVAMSRREDRATSPCSLCSLNPDVTEQVFVNATIDVSDVAVNTSDQGSDGEYESSEDKWITLFPKKTENEAMDGQQEWFASQLESTVVNTEEECYEICDLTFEN